MPQSAFDHVPVEWHEIGSSLDCHPCPQAGKSAQCGTKFRRQSKIGAGLRPRGPESESCGQQLTRAKEVWVGHRGLAQPVRGGIEITQKQSAHPEIVQQHRRLWIVRGQSHTSLHVRERRLRLPKKRKREADLACRHRGVRRQVCRHFQFDSRLLKAALQTAQDAEDEMGEGRVPVGLQNFRQQSLGMGHILPDGWAQVLAHGRLVAFYSDRHGIFRVNAKVATTGDGKTEFGRLAERLGIAVIHARTPQAKGRVERANQTLQDRLVKEMRLRVSLLGTVDLGLESCHHPS